MRAAAVAVDAPQALRRASRSSRRPAARTRPGPHRLELRDRVRALVAAPAGGPRRAARAARHATAAVGGRGHARQPAASERLEQDLGVTGAGQARLRVAQRGVLVPAQVRAEVVADEPDRGARLLQMLAGLVHRRAGVVAPPALQLVDGPLQLRVHDAPDPGRDALSLLQPVGHGPNVPVDRRTDTLDRLVSTG